MITAFIHWWWIPVASAVIWWGMLIAFLACWTGQGHPVYGWMNAPKSETIVFISDVAASNLQPIFIACAGAQGLLFVIALVLERYFRHAGRLLPNHRKYEKVLAGVAIGLAVIGQLGILFVSIFNTKVFPEAHTSMLAVFIVFVGASSLCTIGEFYCLDRRYPDYRELVISSRFKVVWFLVELAIAIAFVCTKHRHQNASAVLEWTISFIYPFYALCLAWDLWPAHKTKKGELLRYNDFTTYKGDASSPQQAPPMQEHYDHGPYNEAGPPAGPPPAAPHDGRHNIFV